jgi:hypothetical protein
VGPNASADGMSEASNADGNAPFVAATVVGVAAVAGFVGSVASIVAGDFEDPDDRWVAAGGVALGAVALVATWILLRRLQRAARGQLVLPLEARLFIAALRDAVMEKGPLPDRWEQRAVQLYGRLVAAGLRREADELEHWTVQAQARANRLGDIR